MRIRERLNRRGSPGRAAAVAGIAVAFSLMMSGQHAKPSERSTEESHDRKPNILFIFVDDMGYGDLSCYGNTLVETKHIDRLANEGIRLTQFYVASPVCSPSRVGATTGQFPARWRINSYLNTRDHNRKRRMADFLDPKAPSIARAFRQAGYRTGHFGKWHMGGGRDVDDAPLPEAYGFDESLVAFEGLGDRVLPPDIGLSKQSEKLGRGKIVSRAPYNQSSEVFVDRTIDFIKRNGNGPFYVHLWLNDVHDPHRPRPGTTEPFGAITENPFEQNFFAVLTEMDRHIGRLLDVLDERDLTDHTLVFLASDNGPTDQHVYYLRGYTPPGSTGPFRCRKGSLHEGGIRMPFIARWPGRIPAGEVNTHSVVAAVDLYSTLCKLAGIEIETPAPAFDGEDMSRALLGQPQQRAGTLFWEYGRDDTHYFKGHLPKNHSPNCGLRQRQWKLLANADGSQAQLYDLAADPGEENNLANQHPDLTEHLLKKLLQWRQSLP